MNKKVPDAIESQSGVVSRELKKAFETFDISKQKEFKREQKIVAKASEHLLNTSQRFNDETALMAANLFLLEDDVIEAQRRSARMAEIVWDRSINQVRELKDVIEKERSTREKEDADLLDTVIETQQLLQEMVLEYFGSDADSGDKEKKGGNSKGQSKLAKRMEKIDAKKKGLTEESSASDPTSVSVSASASEGGEPVDGESSSQSPANEE